MTTDYVHIVQYQPQNTINTKDHKDALLSLLSYGTVMVDFFFGFDRGVCGKVLKTY